MKFSLQLLVLACHVNYLLLETFNNFVTTLESVVHHFLHVADFLQELRLHVLHLPLEGKQTGMGSSQSEIETALATRRNRSKLVSVDMNLIHLNYNYGEK